MATSPSIVMSCMTEQSSTVIHNKETRRLLENFIFNIHALFQYENGIYCCGHSEHLYDITKILLKIYIISVCAQVLKYTIHQQPVV